MAETPRLLGVKKIWDHASHNALCDLIRFQGSWLAAFRESDAHAGGSDGAIRIIRSLDGDRWESHAFFKEKGIDLRDPKLSITPQGKLMLLAGGSKYQESTYKTRHPRAAFSDDAKHWGPLIPILNEGDWLWRLTWHNGIGYGTSYRIEDESVPEGEWSIKLYSTSDGINYKMAANWPIYGKPSEATVRFDNNGKMVALVRREKRFHRHAWIGVSDPPYVQWSWHDSGHYFGGPNFVILPNGEMWAGGRLVEVNPYGFYAQTALARMTTTNLHPELVLPSGGIDTSYPGMVYEDGILWMNYYSSHETNTAIYLAKIAL